jgi:hypothetical protein
MKCGQIAASSKMLNSAALKMVQQAYAQKDEAEAAFLRQQQRIDAMVNNLVKDHVIKLQDENLQKNIEVMKELAHKVTIEYESIVSGPTEH